MDDAAVLARVRRCGFRPRAGRFPERLGSEGRKQMTKKYEALCARLGFSSTANFVRVHRGGAIGFTAGKPAEVRQLLAAVRSAGMRPAKGLVAAASRGM